jgi:branched-chain amino acid transport system ATP-binding protein
MTAEQHVLVAERVLVDFGGVRALEIAHLEIRSDGAPAALLMGPNGAGKTTFLDTISGFVRPTSGTLIRLRAGNSEVDIARASRVQRVRAGVTRTFQRPPVFRSLTVGESIDIATRRSWFRRGRSRRLTDAVDALVEVLGLGDLLSRATATLPLHVLRRVELARALTTEPRLLLLDEPTAGSDDCEREHLAKFLSTTLPPLVTKLHAAGEYRFPHVASCVVTHDMKLAAMLCNGQAPGPVVHVLSQGRLRASGSFRELIQDVELRSSYFGGQ